MESEESHFLGDLDAIDIDVAVRTGRLVARLDEMAVDHCREHMAGFHQHLHLRINIAIDDQFIDHLACFIICLPVQAMRPAHLPMPINGILHPSVADAAACKLRFQKNPVL